MKNLMHVLILGISLSSFLYSTSLSAQSTATYDRIYLKDGNYLTGNIIKEYHGEGYDLETKDGDLIYIANEKISSVEHDIISASGGGGGYALAMIIIGAAEGIVHLEGGFMSGLNRATTYKYDRWSRQFPSLEEELRSGYSLRLLVKVPLGRGDIDFISSIGGDIYDNGATIYPYQLGLRYRLKPLSEKFTPFLQATGGGIFGNSKEVHYFPENSSYLYSRSSFGGWTYEASAGIRGVFKNLELGLSAGFSYQGLGKGIEFEKVPFRNGFLKLSIGRKPQSRR